MTWGLGTTPLLESRDDGLGGRGAHLVIPSVIGPIVAAILVLNRAYWRLVLVNALAYDDMFILLSTASAPAPPCEMLD